jgi:hypothetical protein
VHEMLNHTGSARSWIDGGSIRLVKECLMGWHSEATLC